MIEYEIYNERTNEHNFIHGYNREDAWARNKWADRREWRIIHTEYIDWEDAQASFFFYWYIVS